LPHDFGQSSLVLRAPPRLNTRNHAIFVDFDGTLVDIAVTPDAVVVHDDLRALLRALGDDLDGALALLTGRTIGSVEALLHGAIENIAGLHGFEQRLGDITTRALDNVSAIAAAAAEARAVLSADARPVRIEDKTAGLALHYREAPEAGAAVRRFAETLAEKHGLSLIEGKMVVELTLGVRDKGDALRAFMDVAPFAGRAPIAIGDDRTDEDAFAAAEALGGFGVLVGPPKPSAARYRLDDARAVAAWLEQRGAS
jgi:trehalose 6-phosphate phosphatase